MIYAVHPLQRVTVYIIVSENGIKVVAVSMLDVVHWVRSI